jgi:hypothetical protein
MKVFPTFKVNDPQKKGKRKLKVKKKKNIKGGKKRRRNKNMKEFQKVKVIFFLLSRIK